jgi:hypothetical protein
VVEPSVQVTVTFPSEATRTLFNVGAPTAAADAAVAPGRRHASSAAPIAAPARSSLNRVMLGLPLTSDPGNGWCAGVPGRM